MNSSNKLLISIQKQDYTEVSLNHHLKTKNGRRQGALSFCLFDVEIDYFVTVGTETRARAKGLQRTGRGISPFLIRMWKHPLLVVACAQQTNLHPSHQS